MKKVVRVLACCLVLAGCAGAEAEVAMKAVDFSKPVPPYTFFVTCGPLEGITMYPLPLQGKYTVEGKYRLSSSRNDLSLIDMSSTATSNDRIIINIPDDRNIGVNANFFVHGLANGCTGVFAAERVHLMRTEMMLKSVWEYGLTHSKVVDAAYMALESDPRTSADVHKNALFIRVVAWERPKVGGITSFMIFSGDAYGDLIVRLEE
ncbi:MAG: hypothetical protein IOD01_15355 [Rhodobacter sp.]|jgi:hypothetical protein|nr:hypothetical protein [Rhodobacter sp.]